MTFEDLLKVVAALISFNLIMFAMIALRIFPTENIILNFVILTVMAFASYLGQKLIDRFIELRSDFE